MKAPIRMLALGVTLVLAFAAARSVRAIQQSCVPVLCGFCCTSVTGSVQCFYKPCLPNS